MASRDPPCEIVIGPQPNIKTPMRWFGRTERHEHQPPPDDAGLNDYHDPHCPAVVPHSISESHDAMRPSKLVKATTDNMKERNIQFPMHSNVISRSAMSRTLASVPA